MAEPADQDKLVAEDIRQLHSLGYGQELLRRMSGFSNFAVSLSIICILAGGITSFHIGFCSVGGASIGLGWPFACLLSLAFAATMGQVASAFPTAGGLYHWASILGGRGWGWATAWFNLAGLIAVLAAINVGTFRFVAGALRTTFDCDVKSLGDTNALIIQIASVAAITLSHGLFNHLGIRLTTRLTDFSGWWIMFVAAGLTAVLVAFAPSHDFGRLLTFTNYSGLPEGEDAVWPSGESLLWLFALGLMLPAYTITGFDASAHTAEETVGAAREVPRGIVNSVLISGLFGWVMVCAIVLAMPDLDTAAVQGEDVFYWTMNESLPRWLAVVLFAAIAVAQYLCGLATVTSASRMAYAFARDGGLPGSRWLRSVSHKFRTPAPAIWVVCVLAVGFSAYTPEYSTIAVVAVIYLYLSYATPALFGLFAHGRSWTKMGPWTLGPWFRPLAVISIVGCAFFVVIGVQPPNEKALWTTLASFALLAAGWFSIERRRFRGPPQGVHIQERQAEIAAVERAVGEL